MRGLRVSKQPGDLSSLCITELSTGPFCVIRSNPTHQLTDPTQLNPLQVGKFGPNATQPNTTNLTAWCSQILSDRALNALKFQNFSTFAGVDPTEPTKNWKISTQPNPIQPKWVNPTRGQLCFVECSALKYTQSVLPWLRTFLFVSSLPVASSLYWWRYVACWLVVRPLDSSITPVLVELCGLLASGQAVGQ